MKLKKIKINGFGNLNDKEIELSDNINIIYGKNETGKSTLLKFITNIFYGTSKNKKGRYASDYDMYKPWSNQEFSGKINYELDNGENFEVYREFGKKNPKIYNSNLEDISKQFNIDKNTGNQFFYDQTKVDEDTFLSTVVSMQQEVKLDNQSQNVLIQKIANIAGTGEDNISYKKAMEKLIKKQNEEIGTARTQERPINIAIQKLNKLKQEKSELEKFRNIKYEFEDKKNKIEQEILELEIEKEVVTNTKLILESQKIEQEKIEYNKNILMQNDEKIDEITFEIKQYQSQLHQENKGKSKFNSLLISLLILCGVLAGTIVIGKYFISIAIAVLVAILTVIYIKNIRKIKNKTNKNNSEISNKINQKEVERKILEQNNNQIEKNIQLGTSKINEEIFKEKQKIKEQLQSKLQNIAETEKIKQNIEQLSYNQLSEKLEELTQKINDKKLELHRLDLNKSNITPKLDNLAKIEEELETTEEEYNNLNKRNENMILAKQLLEKAYEKMKNCITPKFTENLSRNLEKFSQNRYKKVTVNDENGLLVEIPSGEYISAEMLSVGTIDQLYLALRLSMINEVTKETLPIILDEAFAYFDDERLKNVLQFISENYKDRQIIILTCTKREQQILEETGINYNKIKM